MWSHEKNNAIGLSANLPILPSETLFVSDVHLGGYDSLQNKEIEHDFLLLLTWCKKQNVTVVLLGDIFDYYMQYGAYTPEIAQRTLAWFKEYHSGKANGSTLYITGNHDNWDFGALKQAGFDTEHEFRFYRTSTNSTVMLMHGDGLSEPAFRFHRPLFHRVLRNPYFIKIFKAFTGGESGNNIMKIFSNWSRKNDDGDNHDKAHLDTNAIRILSELPIDVLICGHHHETRDITSGNKHYINTGAFFSERTACLYTNGSFQLVKWNGANNTISKLI